MAIGGEIGRGIGGLLGQRHIEAQLLIPQPLIDLGAEGGRFLLHLLGKRGVPLPPGQGGDGLGACVLITIQRGAQAGAADGEFAAVPVIRGPIQAQRALALLLPAGVAFLHGGQQIKPRFVAAQQGQPLDGGLQRVAVIMQMHAAVGVPETNVIIQEAAFPQPAALAHMVGRGAGDGVVFPGPAHIRVELGEHKALGRALHMLAIHPPAEIIRPLDFRVGNGDARGPGQQPILRRRVGHRLHHVFLIRAVKGLHIFAQNALGVYFLHSSNPRSRPS